ncbi:MAG TPA: hemolysin family protein [Terriglobales bacterium]|nr:hemolysin family protein [Terriglobales bacterium]
MILAIIGVALLLALLTISAYIERVYQEMGKFLSRNFQENIESFELRVEPRIGSSRQRISLSFAVISRLASAGIAFGTAYFVVRDGIVTAEEIVQSVLAVVLAIIVFDRLLPFVLFTRTRGDWLVPFTLVLKVMVWLLLPITIVLGFCQQIAALAEPNEPVENETQSEAVDALIEAGQEEGILEEGDRRLIQSVVEFRDKTVREVMTPRPDIFAIPISTTIEAFTEMLRKTPYSRVPVYEGVIDNIKGLIFAHDVLQISDVDARTKTVATLLKPVHYVPESKSVESLMREMQKQNLHFAVVIDEYGGVAGVVTIEDLLEEIVGEIRDEHEFDVDVFKESDRSYVMTGNTDVDRLRELFGVRLEGFEATTVAGLVTEIAGRIPHPGEVIEQSQLRFEVLAATDRVVERLRVSSTQVPEASEPEQLRA